MKGRVHKTIRLRRWPPSRKTLQAAWDDFSSDTYLTRVYVSPDLTPEDPSWPSDLYAVTSPEVVTDMTFAARTMVWEGHQADKKGERVYRVKIRG